MVGSHILYVVCSTLYYDPRLGDVTLILVQGHKTWAISKSDVKYLFFRLELSKCYCALDCGYWTKVMTHLWIKNSIGVKYYHSHITNTMSLWNTDAPGSNKVQIKQNLSFLHFYPAPSQRNMMSVKCEQHLDELTVHSTKLGWNYAQLDRQTYFNSRSKL